MPSFRYEYYPDNKVIFWKEKNKGGERYEEFVTFPETLRQDLFFWFRLQGYYPGAYKGEHSFPMYGNCLTMKTTLESWDNSPDDVYWVEDLMFRLGLSTEEVAERMLKDRVRYVCDIILHR